MSTFIQQTSVLAPDGRVLTVPCYASVAIGDFVSIDGTNTAYKAIATSPADANVLGIVEEKPSATSCAVRLLGLSSISFVGLDATKEYFLSASVAGSLTITPPAGATQVIVSLGKPLNATQFVVNIGQRIQRA